MRENEVIQHELKEISEVVARIPFCNVYSIPEGYTFEFDASLNNKSISSDELVMEDNIKTPFQVPDNYFNALPGHINKKASSASIFGRVLHLSYASRRIAAGILFLMAGLLSFYFFNNHSNSTLPKKDESAVFAEAKKILANNSFDEELAKVDAADIEAYLTSNGHDVNAALMASVESDEEIPNEEDLLMDDQALDQLYKDLNLSSNNTH